MPTGAPAWTAWATTPASAPCSTQVSVAGLRGLWEAKAGPVGRRLGPCLGACRRFLLGWPPGGAWAAASLLLPHLFPRKGL